MTNYTDYYELAPRRRENEAGFTLVTAAVMSCGLCGETIMGMGGPGDKAVCKRCGDELGKGNLVGAVVWEDSGA